MPFVPYLVFDLGLVDDFREPGLYAGIIIAANRVGMMMTSWAFGRWSDKHGRVPVLVLSMAGQGLSALAFGFSSSLEMAVAVRFVGGLAAGGRDLAQVMVTEVCVGCPEHQARAMSTNAAMWGLAVIVGPALGGLLARPASNYPSLFSADGVWGRYPYLPPCLLGFVLCALGLLAMRSLPETVGPRRTFVPPPPDDHAAEGKEDDGEGEAGEGSALLGGGGSERSQVKARRVERKRRGFWSNPVTRTIILIRLIQAFYVVGDDNTFPLWTAAPRYAGGLDFSTSATGAALAMMGATVVFSQLAVYPAVSTQLGVRRAYVLLTLTQVPFFLVQPFASWFGSETKIVRPLPLSLGRLRQTNVLKSTGAVGLPRCVLRQEHVHRDVHRRRGDPAEQRRRRRKIVILSRFACCPSR